MILREINCSELLSIIKNCRDDIFAAYFKVEFVNFCDECLSIIETICRQQNIELYCVQMSKIDYEAREIMKIAQLKTFPVMVFFSHIKTEKIEFTRRDLDNQDKLKEKIIAKISYIRQRINVENKTRNNGNNHNSYWYCNNCGYKFVNNAETICPGCDVPRGE